MSPAARTEMRVLMQTELVEAKQQRDAAQQAFNNAQTQIAQGQQNAGNANAMILTANGAIQECECVLKKLEEPIASPT